MAYGKRSSGHRSPVTSFKLGGKRKGGPGYKLHTDVAAPHGRLAGHKKAVKIARKAV